MATSVLPGVSGATGEGEGAGEEVSPGFCYFNERGYKQYKKNLGQDGLRGDMASFAYVDLPAHKAAFEGNVPALEAVFTWKKDLGVPSFDKMFATPLHIAAKANEPDCIKWLLRFTTLSVLEQADHGETPVHVASALGHYDCVKALLGSGEKDVKDALSVLQDKSGYTCLLLAIQKHQNKIVKLLVNELGAKSVNAINISGITAAHVSASAGNIEALKILLNKHKRLLDQPSADGTTPTYFAAQEGQLEALRFLHEGARCDISTPAGDNLKPIHAAAQAGHTSIVKYIVANLGIDAMLDPVPDGGTPLHFAATSGKIKTARWIVNNDMTGLVVFARDENGDTPAHDAAGAGEVEMLKFLLDNGAKINATNKSGATPYSNALGSTNPAMVELVVTYNTAMKEGNTEIDGAIEEEKEEMEVEAIVEEVAPIETHPGPAEPGPNPQVSHEYATVTEIQETEERRTKKQKSRGLKSIQNALRRPLRKKSKTEVDEQSSDFGEIGYRPAHRSNPLSKFMSSGGKGDKKPSRTPTTPPPTPATYSSENTQDNLNELESGVYSTVDQDVVAKKKRHNKIKEEQENDDKEPPPIPEQNFEKPEGSVSRLSFTSTDSNTTGSKKTSPMGAEKWPHSLLLEDTIVVTEKEVMAAKSSVLKPEDMGVPSLKVQVPSEKLGQEEEEDEEGKVTLIEEGSS